MKAAKEYYSRAESMKRWQKEEEEAALIHGSEAGEVNSITSSGNARYVLSPSARLLYSREYNQKSGNKEGLRVN
jgi:hypothetical protein